MLISVIIPAYNCASDLQFCLASIVAQTDQEWECIVVDDGSALPLEAVVSALDDPRIRVIRHSENRGRGAARASGLAAARGELLAWQDADDWSFPGRLARQREVLRASPRLAFVGVAAAVVDKAERLVGVREGMSDTGRLLRPFEAPPIVHPSLLFRRKVIEHHNYRPGLRFSEDLDFLSRALSEFAFTSTNDLLYCYREFQSQSVRKYWGSTRTRLGVVASSASEYPLRALFAGAGQIGKCVAYAGFSWLGMQDLLLRHRSRNPAPAEARAYAAARAVVSAQLKRCCD